MDALDSSAATEAERESVRPRPRCRCPVGALSSVPTPCSRRAATLTPAGRHHEAPVHAVPREDEHEFYPRLPARGPHGDPDLTLALTLTLVLALALALTLTTDPSPSPGPGPNPSPSPSPNAYQVADLVAPQTPGEGEARDSQLPSVQLEVPSKETLSRISTEEAIVAQLRGFVRGDAQLTERYLQRLRAIHSTLSACRPFSEHQFINSSLLFVHDVRARARASTATGRTPPPPRPRLHLRSLPPLPLALGPPSQPFCGARRPRGSAVACG